MMRVTVQGKDNVDFAYHLMTYIRSRVNSLLLARALPLGMGCASNINFMISLIVKSR